MTIVSNASLSILVFVFHSVIMATLKEHSVFGIMTYIMTNMQPILLIDPSVMFRIMVTSVNDDCDL